MRDEEITDDMSFPISFYVKRYKVPEKWLREAVDLETIDFIRNGPRGLRIIFGGFRKWYKIYYTKARV